MAHLINPYVAGSQVGGSAAFIGREDIVKEVFRILHHASQNSIVLYGQRRIGKTSLLHHLCRRLKHEGRYQPVYFDLQDRGTLVLGDLLAILAQTIARDINLLPPNLGPHPERAFGERWLPETIEILVKENKSLVLLFDEFDVLGDPQREHASMNFFPYLRQLMELNTAHLQFVFVIGRNMAELRHDALAIFKGTQARSVSLLNQRDTEELVRLSEKNKTLSWTDASVAKIWELTRGHPYLTQSLCSQVWELAHDGPTSKSIADCQEVEEAIKDTLDGSRNTLEWLWAGLSPAQKIVAAALAHVGPDPVDTDKLNQVLTESGARIVIRELRDAPRLLQDWDIVEQVGDSYRFRVELLRQWIKLNKPLSRVQDDLDRIQPLAENLYNSARGYAQLDEWAEAEKLLRQTVNLNPNHQRANELLVDTYLVQQRMDEAETLLQRFMEYAPQLARPRLLQVYLNKAAQLTDVDALFDLYTNILAIDPQNAEAKTKQEFFGKTQQEINTAMEQILQLEAEHKYKRARSIAKKLSKKFPTNSEWKALVSRLNRKVQIPKVYQSAILALQEKRRDDAEELLREIVYLEPNFEEASHLLHLAKSMKTDEEIALLVRRMFQTSSEPQTIMRELSPWNPLDPILLLFWLMLAPARMKEYLETYGTSVRNVGSWLCSGLIWIPMSMPILGIATGRIPSSGWIGEWSPVAYYIVLGILLVTWIVCGISHQISSITTILNSLALGLSMAMVAFKIENQVLIFVFFSLFALIIGVAVSVGTVVWDKYAVFSIHGMPLVIFAAWISTLMADWTRVSIAEGVTQTADQLGRVLAKGFDLFRYFSGFGAGLGTGSLLFAFVVGISGITSSDPASEYPDTIDSRIAKKQSSIWTFFVLVLGMTAIFLLSFGSSWIAHVLPGLGSRLGF